MLPLNSLEVNYLQGRIGMGGGGINITGFVI